MSNLHKSRGKEDGRKKVETKRDGKPVVVMDYKSVGDDFAEVDEQTGEAEVQLQAIVMMHQGAGMIAGRIVEKKAIVTNGWRTNWPKRLLDGVAQTSS